MRIASLVLCCALLSGVQPAWAAGNATEAKQSSYTLDEIVVTGSALPQSLRTIPRNVTVITSDDIARSSAASLPELLAREPGLQLFNNSGVEGRGLIDIRGQGAASATNVLVLVDGFRLNAVDMSGPNLSTVSLAQIERIEVLRGPGSVLYGDNAVGGVINIITKNARNVKPAFQASAQYGSYDSTKTSASFQGSKGPFSLGVIGQYSDTDGYRENGDLERKDVQLRVGLDPHPDLSLDVTLAAHDESYGLPGGVPLADLDDRDERRETSQPDDHGRMSEARVQGHISYDLHQFGALNAALAVRDRDNPYIFWGVDGNIDENTVDWKVSWDKAFTVGGLQQRLLVGVDGFRSDYDMSSLYGDTIGVITSTALYSTLDLSLTRSLHLSLGGRTSVHDIDRENGDDTDWHKSVFDAGFSYDLDSWGRVYASVASGFRAPTIDEMNFAASDIKPQTSMNYEVGVDLTPLQNLEMNVAAYYLRTKDEIYYDNINWNNDNYDDVTMRKGLEVDVTYWVRNDLTLRGGYAWTHARFEDTGKTVPLVAEHEFSLGADWRAFESVLLSVDARHATAKYDGSDVDNTTYEKIDGYTVVDLKGRWDMTEHFALTMAVNNVFDELYSTTAYAESYYVMPGRNIMAGIEASF